MYILLYSYKVTNQDNSVYLLLTQKGHSTRTVCADLSTHVPKQDIVLSDSRVSPVHLVWRITCMHRSLSHLLWVQTMVHCIRSHMGKWWEDESDKAPT